MSYEEVTNEGKPRTCCAVVGGSPRLNCPLDEGESYDDYELRFEQRGPVLPFLDRPD